ncbi:ZIP family metal transporter [Candidatus Pacearchaeota archaeon CG10_big_fil_rev_8_21_14_0_10_31_9]|nr:MAG: ZIP family metal transporter [Candidatus Pacearchaeota archaeon CG10_big_fil_rev_8_21_14_0_10_31_9]PIZ82458.1 MAG: ZIP family metal transporter [Candidatus Pacearchaeota archaeon CG_4_10_14_0_2_um_filter_05_32_18]
MLSVWLYTTISIIAISVISLVGIVFLSLKSEKLEKILVYMISFSAGALLGDAFIHLMPEAVEVAGFSSVISFSVLAGIAFSFTAEKVIHWRHCHHPITKNHQHHLSKMNLVGESVHNFIDGIIIATSYLVSIPVGIATTIAVVFHEIPQEISDFGVLVYGGFTKKKALLANFLIALTAVIGAIITLLIGTGVENILTLLIPFAAGNFIYIACSDLIPELHKETKLKISLTQLILFVLGILVMAALLLVEI